MKKIDSFINCYPLSKTLRFSLLPVGKTEETFNAKMMLQEDEKRAESYEKVKEYIDRYHKKFIESALSKFVFSDLQTYADLYRKSNKSDSDKKIMQKEEEKLRKEISKALTSSDGYAAMFKADMIKELLPKFLTDEEEKATVSEFYSFTTYFTGFFKNRKNMYSDKGESTSIAYRCINDNLPKFLDNMKNFAAIKSSLSQESFDELNENFKGLFGVTVENMFELDYFNFVLSRSGIERYNEVIGGYTCSDGTKVKGLNEYINLYNQQYAKTDRSKRLPLLKPLFKQILSDTESISFIPDKFSSDDELLKAVYDFYKMPTKDAKSAETTIKKIETLFSNLNLYDINRIYVLNTAVTEISKAVFKSWNVIQDAWNAEYSAKHPMKKKQNAEKYDDERRKAFKKISSFSIAELQQLGDLKKPDDCDGSISEYFKTTVLEKVSGIRNNYKAAEKLLTEKYEADKKLCCNDEAIEHIKNFLDSIKDLEHLIKPLNGTGKEEDKDSVFYGEFSPMLSDLSTIDRLYDKVRNYMTQKPYSKDKIKLNFNNPQFLGGWDKNKEKDYRAVLLRKDRMYYLAVMDRSNSKAFVDPPIADGSELYEKIEYKLLPDPNKMLPKVFFADSNLSTFNPSKRILEIRKNETFKKGDSFNIDDCHGFIDYFKDSIERHEDWHKFNFEFSPTKSYNDISEFYNEVKNQGYSIHFKEIPSSYIHHLVDTSELFLFKIYNKDFSEYSKGNPNLHTMYFKMLFDERNLKNVVYKLDGGAEMFYRKASIADKEKIVHPANQAVKNKNPENEKSQSVFKYDIIKDRRFTKRQFSLHVPITLNFKAPGINYINDNVRMALKNSDENFVIGIDRGERNLIYVCVVNSKGKIVEQMSLNKIIGDNGYKVDYHDLLERKEDERKKAKQNWTSVENIKELKEGYLSQVIHKICELVIKYDAVIAMEDLNSGFKNSRIKVEKQVYQKFEKMLTDKLNYLVDKKIAPEENGGILRAYQLTNKDFKHKGAQDGFIFYVPAWMTSKIDPTTGFADLLYPRYTTIPAAKEFFSKFKSILYNKETDMFEFSFNYSDFPRGSQDYRNSWTICSNGERILTFRNPEKNSEWDNKTIVLTDEFKSLFQKYGIDIYGDIKEAILKQNSKDFFIQLINLLKHTLQMRNSDKDNDYIISPVRNSSGKFYDSRYSDGTTPKDADANGAYNIARKALWAIDVLKSTPDDKLAKAKISITNRDWLKYAQGGK